MDTELSDVSAIVIARALETETRLGENVRVELHGTVTEVQRGEALVLAIGTSALRRGAIEPYLPRIAPGHAGVLVIGELPEGFLDRMPKTAVIAHLPDLSVADHVYLAALGVLDRVELRLGSERRARWLNRYRYELGEIIEISRAISQERDIDRLLGLILEKSRFITGADAGSIYVVESKGPSVVSERRLRFKLSQNDSVSFQSREFTVPMTTRSIAGAAAVTRKAINIPDVYELIPPEGATGAADNSSILPSAADLAKTVRLFSFDPSFDRKIGYRTKSMIAVPMISAEDDVIGVIQLINKKREPKNKLTKPEDTQTEVVPFDQRSEDLLATLASQASIALENALLYDEIRRIFDGFVRASVQAIEQRDPTTSGHSFRVSVFSTALAEAVDRVSSGPYKDSKFSRRELKELEYASLLHDFGKIGVREEVLVKAKKLYPQQLDGVRSRFDYVLLQIEKERFERKLVAAQQGAGASDLRAIDEQLDARKAEIDAAWAVVTASNEPTVLKEGEFTRILELGQRSYVDACGHVQPLLTANEVTSLQVQKGSLNDAEIDQIRSHVVHTKDFLSRIPWGKNFARIPDIAGAHHEKLNGRGYPNGITADQIPLPSKIMTIADIFDALTARDRPYKKAMPLDRALAILGYEVKDGHIDAELVRIFTEAEGWKAVETQPA
jgi:HD-GYP domain-containing protein (c-di-GMP phosphodiesterase class II)